MKTFEVLCSFFPDGLFIIIDDHSRIVLKEKWTETDNDYINANFIKVNNKY